VEVVSQNATLPVAFSANAGRARRDGRTRRKEVRSIIDIANANDVNYRSYSAASMIRLKDEIEAIDHAIGDEGKPAPADSASMIA
jgi:hypothetical protein